MANHLIHESSPYLLQHAHNPIDWYPWSEEPLQRAVEEERPIFLSIGYAACHWCHVMERESFENQRIAQLLNDHFISIKVDREERPDLDQVYMAAVQLMSGRGGWPLSLFLTPALQPFFGGTYWSSSSYLTSMSFEQVLVAVIRSWEEQRADLLHQGARISQQIDRYLRSLGGVGEMEEKTVIRAVAELKQSFDDQYGGFGLAPKFPHPMIVRFLLRSYHRTGRQELLQMVSLTLERMAQGGIHDHLAGGFARYSVDDKWHVPHFEKMIYDNALLAGAYLDGYLATQRPLYATIVRDILDYSLTYMRDQGGGFHSSEDADSGGEEGLFYLWDQTEIQQLLGEEQALRFSCVYGIEAEGNFEGSNILYQSKSMAEWAQIKGWECEELEKQMTNCRKKLLQRRDQRPRPMKDDKVIVAWNGLMIDSLARAAMVLDEPRYLTAAQEAAEFILTKLRDEEGRLLHSWRAAPSRYRAYLDDYSCLANGLLSLYEATLMERWLTEAAQLVSSVYQLFEDPAGGGFFFTAHDQTSPLTRIKELHDQPIPSSNGMMATVLIRLGALLGRNDYLEKSREIIGWAKNVVEEYPIATGQLLLALDMAVGPFSTLLFVADPHQPATKRIVETVRKCYLPNIVIALQDSTLPLPSSSLLAPLFAGKEGEGKEPLLFPCQNFSCQQAIEGEEQIIRFCQELSRPKQMPKMDG